MVANKRKFRIEPPDTLRPKNGIADTRRGFLIIRRRWCLVRMKKGSSIVNRWLFKHGPLKAVGKGEKIVKDPGSGKEQEDNGPGYGSLSGQVEIMCSLNGYNQPGREDNSQGGE